MCFYHKGKSKSAHGRETLKSKHLRQYLLATLEEVRTHSKFLYFCLFTVVLLLSVTHCAFLIQIGELKRKTKCSQNAEFLIVEILCTLIYQWLLVLQIDTIAGKCIAYVAIHIYFLLCSWLNKVKMA